MRRLVISESTARRAYKSLDKKFNRVDKTDMIPTREKMIPALIPCNCDLGALDHLTKTILQFIVSIAKQYEFQGLTLYDLINAGSIGLIITAKWYGEKKAFKFISYAFWWIRQSVITAITGHTCVVRIPCHKLTLFGKLYKAFSRLEQFHCRKLSAGELADLLEIPVKDVLDLLSKPGTNISLDQPISEDEELTLMDVLHNIESDNDDRIMFSSISNAAGYY